MKPIENQSSARVQKARIRNAPKGIVIVISLFLALFTTVTFMQSQQSAKQFAQSVITPTFACLGLGACETTPTAQPTVIGQVCETDGDCQYGLICKDNACKVNPNPSVPPPALQNTVQLGGSCTTKNKTDFTGGCDTNLTCDTKTDTSSNCTNSNQCAGTCIVSTTGTDTVIGKACTTKPSDPNGVVGNCGTTSVICDTKADTSSPCKKDGTCTGTCQASSPGKLPGQPCKTTSKTDWQGGCVNGQKCSTTSDTSSTCKTTGKCNGICTNN